ncbi:acetyltransferase [Mucilaginibacter sp.]|uniref:acetyltransferase n=1 Tax=Mucilaginibacter sp. TaxID=1882438 RepID=UPI0035BBA9FF
MDKQAILIGYSGHAYVLIEILYNNNCQILGYCDNAPVSENPYGLTFLGNESNQETVKVLKCNNVYLAIGDNKIRSSLYKQLAVEKEITFPNLLHQRSIISSSVNIGNASVVMQGAVINAQASIGIASIINTSAIIEHNCVVGDYSHIAPGVVLTGNVTVGNYTFVGANSVVKQGVKIGSNVIVGAGSVVLRDIADGLTVYGNPALVKSI